MQNLIKNDPQRPYIDSVCVIMKLCLLGGNVLLCAGYGLHDYLLSTKPKICELDHW
jgi:hypothetical protein